MYHLDREGTEQDLESAESRRLAVDCVIREAIASAGISGVNISDRAAKEFLRSGRAPMGGEERLLAGMVKSMEEMEEVRELSPAMLGKLNGLILRDAGKERDLSGETEAAARTEELCGLANGGSGGAFIHPFVRAAAVHYWLLRERPFADANGRMGRLLQSWLLRREGYSLFRYLPVSAEIQETRDEYPGVSGRRDPGELAEFVRFSAKVIRNSWERWRNDMEAREERMRNLMRSGGGFAALNPRQQAVVEHALRNPGTTYQIRCHQYCHGVTHQTARDDLFGLADRGLMKIGKDGREYRFTAVDDIKPQLQSAEKRVRRPAVIEEETLPTSLL